MKIEMDEESSTCITFSTVGTILLLCIASVSMHGCSECEKTERVAMESGLVQKMEPQAAMKVWTKQ